jgi:acetolactate synthase I/II/III large subunit
VPSGADGAVIATALDRLAEAKRPLFFLGNGCRRVLQLADRRNRFRQFAEKFAIPVMTTPDGKGIFPESDNLSLRLSLRLADALH